MIHNKLYLVMQQDYKYFPPENIHRSQNLGGDLYMRLTKIFLERHKSVSLSPFLSWKLLLNALETSQQDQTMHPCAALSPTLLEKQN